MWLQVRSSFLPRCKWPRRTLSWCGRCSAIRSWERTIRLTNSNTKQTMHKVRLCELWIWLCRLGAGAAEQSKEVRLWFTTRVSLPWCPDQKVVFGFWHRTYRQPPRVIKWKTAFEWVRRPPSLVLRCGPERGPSHIYEQYPVRAYFRRFGIKFDIVQGPHCQSRMV
jgi:hypothetical protein